MAVPTLPSFTYLVNAVMAQREDNVAPSFKLSHALLFNAACMETDHERLVSGMYQLRWIIVEGGAVHQWIAVLNRSLRTATFPMTVLKRELIFGWLLFQIDQIQSATYAYDQADIHLRKMLFSKNAIKQWPSLYEAWLDISLGKLLMRADRYACTDDVEDANSLWEYASRQSATHCDRRMQLARAGVLLAAGFNEASHIVANSVYKYFDARHMNAEAGLAAFYIMRCEALEHGIDPIMHPITGLPYNWLMIAVRHWRDAIGMPIGLRLLRPYTSQLGIDLSLNCAPSAEFELNLKTNIYN